jgi:hypothetical protein
MHMREAVSGNALRVSTSHLLQIHIAPVGAVTCCQQSMLQMKASNAAAGVEAANFTERQKLIAKKMP